MARAPALRVARVAALLRAAWMLLFPLAQPGLPGLLLAAATTAGLLGFSAIHNTALATYRLQATPDHLMTRTATAWSVAIRSAQPIFIAFGAVFAATLGVRPALWIGAAILAVSAFMRPRHTIPGGATRNIGGPAALPSATVSGMPADPATDRLSFDRDVVAYQQGRPPYPPEVYDLLTAHYGLSPGCRVLEIGAGSGIATCELLSRGARVTAVEPAAAFVDLLRERHAGEPLTVIHADFERAHLTAAFDLALAATSWHWVDGPVGVPKVASLLRPGGGFAVWWTVFGDPDRPTTEFRSLLDPLYARFMPGEVDDGRPPKPLRTEEWMAQLQTGGWFTRPDIKLISWTQHLTAQSATALWATFPNVAQLPPADRNAFLTGVAKAAEDAGGRIDDPRLTIVYHSRRSAQT